MHFLAFERSRNIKYPGEHTPSPLPPPPVDSSLLVCLSSPPPPLPTRKLAARALFLLCLARSRVFLLGLTLSRNFIGQFGLCFRLEKGKKTFRTGLILTECSRKCVSAVPSSDVGHYIVFISVKLDVYVQVTAFLTLLVTLLKSARKLTLPNDSLSTEEDRGPS